MLFPDPVGATDRTSRPASIASTTAACPGRKASRPKTSRSTSSAWVITGTQFDAMSSPGQRHLQRYAWIMAELAGGAPRSEQATVGDAFAWASHDPGWIGKVILMGLIGLIPIVGPLQQAGWMLAALDNLRAGRHEVPPAAFRYASRGVWLFLAALVYAVVVGVVFYGGVFALAFGLSPGHSTQQS